MPGLVQSSPSHAGKLEELPLLTRGAGVRPEPPVDTRTPLVSPHTPFHFRERPPASLRAVVKHGEGASVTCPPRRPRRDRRAGSVRSADTGTKRRLRPGCNEAGWREIPPGISLSLFWERG